MGSPEQQRSEIVVTRHLLFMHITFKLLVSPVSIEMRDGHFFLQSKHRGMDLNLSWDCIQMYNSTEHDSELYSVLSHLVDRAATAQSPSTVFPHRDSNAAALIAVLKTDHSPHVSFGSAVNK